MDIDRIQREFSEAQQRFALVELRPTTDGKVYAEPALQTANGRNYVLSIKFPDNYPNEMPRVFVDAPDDYQCAAPISGRAHLLPAPVDVEPGRSQPDLCHRAGREMAKQVRSVAQQRG